MAHRFSTQFTPAGMRTVIVAAKIAFTNPRSVYRLLLSQGYRMLPRHEVERPPTTAEVESCAGLFGLPAERATSAWIELHGDETFRSEIQEKLWSTSFGPDKVYSSWRDLLYVIVRLKQPETVVETGVRGGLSSAYILNALEENGTGELVSIDIGDVSLLPPDLPRREIGWMIPDRLRSRWELRLDESVTALPELLQTRSVETFFSDVPNSILPTELSILSGTPHPDSVVITCYPENSDAQSVWEQFCADAPGSSITATRWESNDSRSLFGARTIPTGPETSSYRSPELRSTPTDTPVPDLTEL